MAFPTSLTNAVAGVTEIKAEHLNNLEVKVGINGSGVVTSLDYLLKNPAAVDPGHGHTLAALTDITALPAELNLLDLSGLTAGHVLRATGAAAAAWGAIQTADLPTIPVAGGGTGLVSVDQGDLLYAAAADTLASLNKSATPGHYLKNSGTDNNPAWGAIEASHLPTGIDAAKIADGSVSTAEFQYLANVTSDIQGQINTKAPIASPAFTGNVGVGTSTFGTSAANVLGFFNGTAPTTSPADTVQLWAADRGGTADKAGLHVRSEDGTSHVIGDRTGIGTLTPSMFMEIALPAAAAASYLAISSATASTFKTYLATTATNQYAWFTNIRYTGSVFEKDDATRGAWRLGQVCNTTDATCNLNIGYFAVGSVAELNLLRITGVGNVGMSQTTFGTSATNTLAVGNGTAPASSPADCFQMYSADQAAGNACAHFRCEGGAVIKLFQGAALTTALTTITHTAPGTTDYAVQDLTNSGGYGFVTKDEGNTVLSVIANLQARVNELEGRLQAHGFIA